MKIICAWCGKLMGYKCPFCGGELAPAAAPSMAETHMMCVGEPTQIYLSIENMKQTHGICDQCVDKLKSKLTARHTLQFPRPKPLTPEEVITADEAEDAANLAQQIHRGRRIRRAQRLRQAEPGAKEDTE
jgi:hypothetical protein